MASAPMYLVVEYADQNTLAVIPENWLDGCQCALWPPYKENNRLKNAAKSFEVPGDHWRSYPLRKIFYKTPSWDKANRKCKEAELTSDLDTVPEVEDCGDDEERPRLSKRPRRCPQRLEDEWTDDDDTDGETPSTRKGTMKNVAKRNVPCVPPPPPRMSIATSSRGIGSESNRTTVATGTDDDSDGDATCTRVPKKVCRRTVPCAPPPPPPQMSIATSSSGSQPKRAAVSSSMLASALRTVMPNQESSTTPRAGLHAPVSPQTPLPRMPSQTPPRTQSLNRPNLNQMPGSQIRPAPAGLLQENGASLTRLITLMEQMKEEQMAQREMLRTVLARQANNVEQPDDEEDIGLPLSSIEEIRDIERRLDDKAARKMLTRLLGTYGGSTVVDATRRIMKNLVTHDISLQLNMTGAKGKTAFGDNAKLIKIICRAVRQNDDIKDATDKNIEKAISEWFRMASDRNGGRTRREAKKRANEAQSQPGNEDH